MSFYSDLTERIWLRPQALPVEPAATRSLPAFAGDLRSPDSRRPSQSQISGGLGDAVELRIRLKRYVLNVFERVTGRAKPFMVAQFGW